MPYEHWKHWWQEVPKGETALRQGDLFTDLVSFWLPSDLRAFGPDDPPDDLEFEAEWVREDRIILTASCDLDARSASHALLAPVKKANPTNLKAQPGKEYDRRLEALRSDLLPRQFMLSEYPPSDFLRSFVLWNRLVLLPTEYLQGHCDEPRLRLKHPFREKLGLWVGSRMSAVGPEDDMAIPEGGQRPFDVHLLEGVEALDQD